MKYRKDFELKEILCGFDLMLLANARWMALKRLKRNYENSKEFKSVLRAWSNKVEDLVEQSFEDN